jgi:hypothetical protein
MKNENNTSAVGLPKTFMMHGITILIPGIVIISFFVLALQHDLRLSLPLVIGLTALVTVALASACAAAQRGLVSWSPITILIVAALVRLLFLFSSPQLSDDLYRYLWDGLQLLAGHNPYAAAPAEVTNAPAQLLQLQALVNHPSLVTIYPPAAQVVFAIGAGLGGSVIGMKALLLALDLGSCALLLRLLPAFGLPAWGAILYAWHPLPVLEISGSGHIDAAGIFFLLAALSLLVPQAGTRTKSWRAWASGGLYAVSVLVKLFPLVYFPALLALVKQGEKRRFLGGFAVVSLLLSLPFLPHVGNILISLERYGKDWEFSGFVFRFLRLLTSGMTARIVLATLFITLAIVLYTRMLAKLRASIKPDDPTPVFQAMYGITLLYLLLTTTLHPWYALYLVALLPFAAGPAGICLSWSVLLGYQVLILYAISGTWVENDQTAALIWLAPVAAALLSAVAGRIARKV